MVLCREAPGRYSPPHAKGRFSTNRGLRCVVGVIDELCITEPASASRLVDAGSAMRRAGINKTGDAGLARRCRARELQWAGSRAHAQNPNSFLKWCRAAPLGIGGGGGLAVGALLGSEAVAVRLWA